MRRRQSANGTPPVHDVARANLAVEDLDGPRRKSEWALARYRFGEVRGMSADSATATAQRPRMWWSALMQIRYTHLDAGEQCGCIADRVRGTGWLS